MLNLTKSEKLFAEAKQLMPGGVNSPVRAFLSVGGTPPFIKKGEGAIITDEDGNRYVDFCNSWGPLIFGHAHPAILNAIREAAENGTSFGTPCQYEVELARLIVTRVKHIDMIRFVNSGTEAVMSALRLARAFTGRDKIVKFEGCYHGHSDMMLVNAGSGLATFGISSSLGVPSETARNTAVLPLDDETTVTQFMEKHGKDIAAIAIEPIPANNGLLIQRLEFLKTLRSLCDRFGTVLIFDEVISGFRVQFDGAAGYYGIFPDLVTYGKIIGGGLPVGAYAGRRDLMKMVAPVGKMYQAGTLSGNPLAMAAGIAQLDMLKDGSVYRSLEEKGRHLEEALSAIVRKHNYPITLSRFGSIFWLCFDRKAVRRASDIDPTTMTHYKTMHRFMMENGVYLAPSGYEVGFLSDAHTHEHLDTTVALMARVWKDIF